MVPVLQLPTQNQEELMHFKTLFAVWTLSLSTQTFAAPAKMFAEISSCDPAVVTTALGATVASHLRDIQFMGSASAATRAPRQFNHYSVSLKNVSVQAIEAFQPTAMTDQAIRMDINIQFRDEYGSLRQVKTVQNKEISGHFLSKGHGITSFLAWLSPVQDTNGNPIADRCVLTFTPNPTLTSPAEDVTGQMTLAIEESKSKDLRFGRVGFPAFVAKVNEAIARARAKGGR
jgi:hypothetical protein